MHSSQPHVSQNAPKMHVFRDILSGISTVNRLSWYIHYGACVGSHVITWVRLIRCNSPYSTTLGCWWRQWRWRWRWRWRGPFYAVRIGKPARPVARAVRYAAWSVFYARRLRALRCLCLEAAVGLPQCLLHTQPRHPAVHGNISMHMRGSGDCDATGSARPVACL